MQLDKNQRQSRVEKRLLGKNTACLLGNVQPRGGGLYGGRGGQVIWRAGGQNIRNQYRRMEIGPGPIAVDRERGGY